MEAQDDDDGLLTECRGLGGMLVMLPRHLLTLLIPRYLLGTFFVLPTRPSPYRSHRVPRGGEEPSNPPNGWNGARTKAHGQQQRGWLTAAARKAEAPCYGFSSLALSSRPAILTRTRLLSRVHQSVLELPQLNSTQARHA